MQGLRYKELYDLLLNPQIPGFGFSDPYLTALHTRFRNDQNEAGFDE